MDNNLVLSLQRSYDALCGHKVTTTLLQMDFLRINAMSDATAADAQARICLLVCHAEECGA